MTSKQILIIFLLVLILVFYQSIKVWFTRKKLFKKAQRDAANGKVVGYENLGVCYEFGYGVRKDGKQAQEYYHKATRMGSQIGKAKTMNFRKTPVRLKYKKTIDEDALVKELLNKKDT